MKKIIGISLIFGAMAAISFTSCGSGSSLKTTDDSVLYSRVVLTFGQQIDMIRKDSTIDFNAVKAALIDVLNDKSKINADSAQAFLQEYFTVRLPAENLAEGEKFLAEVESSNPNVKKTESGLLYEIVSEGDPNAKPKAIDSVKVAYEGKLKDGKVFDSSYERGDTATFQLNQVIPGWGEGMQLVGKGGKIKLWIPSALGYGERGSQQIEPNEALVFEVDLIDVIPVDTAAVK